MTAARKTQDPAKFARYRQRMKARGLKQVRLWVYDADAPGFQEALDRALDRINASADREDIDRFSDASWADMEADARARETGAPE